MLDLKRRSLMLPQSNFYLHILFRIFLMYSCHFHPVVAALIRSHKLSKGQNYFAAVGGWIHLYCDTWLQVQGETFLMSNYCIHLWLSGLVCKIGIAISRFLFFPSTEVKDLEADSPSLTQLNQSFVELSKNRKIRVISFGESVPTPVMGLDVTFVPPQSSNPGIGEYFLIKNVNHMNICKPESKSSILYRKFVNLVWDVLDEAAPFEIS